MPGARRRNGSIEAAVNRGVPKTQETDSAVKDRKVCAWATDMFGLQPLRHIPTPHQERFPPCLRDRSRFTKGTFAGTRANGRDAPTAVTYPNGGEPSLATHFGRSPSAEEEYEWRIVPILRGPGATCLSPDETSSLAVGVRISLLRVLPVSMIDR